MASGSGVRFTTTGPDLDTILEGSTSESDDGLTKRERLLALITKKKQCDKKAQEIVYTLIETGVEENYVLENAGLISGHHWDDIVEERKISKICGWVLCDNKLGEIPKHQYSIRRNQVYDITERKSFCSSHCYAVSDHFKKQLLVSPLWLRDEEETPKFEILQDSSKQLCGTNLNFNKLNLDNNDDSDDEHDSDEKSEDSEAEEKDLKVMNKDEEES